MLTKRIFVIAVVAIGLVAAARAQTYPDRLIRMVAEPGVEREQPDQRQQCQADAGPDQCCPCSCGHARRLTGAIKTR